jgi:hypothetical protein
LQLQGHALVGDLLQGVEDGRDNGLPGNVSDPVHVWVGEDGLFVVVG